MGVPQYLRILWQSRWLLLVGVIVAAVAAFFAGFQLVDGKVVPRTVQSYTAQTQLLVSSDSDNMYQSVIPGQQVVEGKTQPQPVDLSSQAILYAYVISGADTRQAVESRIGAFSPDESLTALRRTTQPAGDESFPGRYTLPIIAVVGTSNDPARAEDISRTAASVFEKQVVSDQDSSNIPTADRVKVTTLDTGAATEVDGSNPAIPVAITFLGVFLLFVAAAFIIAGARSSRRRRRETYVPAPDAEVQAPDELDEEPVAVGAAPADDDVSWRRSRRRQVEQQEQPASEEDPEREPAYTS
jgi:capsular polysaccharide biosynthesis protein